MNRSSGFYEVVIEKVINLSDKKTATNSLCADPTTSSVFYEVVMEKVINPCRKFLGSLSSSDDKEFWISFSCDGKKGLSSVTKRCRKFLGT